LKILISEKLQDTSRNKIF